MRSIRQLIVLLCGLGLTAVLVSCGGSGSGDSADNIQGKGTVGILLTDMPADPALFESINASIAKVELMGSEENGRVTLYSGEIKTFDLLRLRNEAIPLAFKDDVPAGIYCKIRLTLSDLELVLTEDAIQNSGYEETYHPKLPGNGKLDLVVRDCFNVVADEVVTLQVDMDMSNSFHIVGNNNGFNFRPVIFVDVLNEAFDSKLVRLTGKITRIDKDKQSLLLCEAIPSENMDNEGCVKVHFGGDSAFFDNLNNNGTPHPLDDLLVDTNLYTELTVVGWPKLGDDHDAEDKNSYYYPLMQLDALVAELGAFLQVEGSVAVSADPDNPVGFSMNVSPGNPIITDEFLAVMFQPGGSDFNGTRIVSKSGELLAPADVKEPLPVQVDGVLQLGSSAILKAALVIIDKSTLDAEQVTGITTSPVDVDTNTITVNPDSPTVCGIPIDSLLVKLADDLKILTVTITENSSVIAPGGELDVGQTVGMNGTCGSDGYYTDNVVIVDD